jgi:hypothetical protein
MATYKVPQDVEAEDKLLGPFTFRQFIYLIVVALSIAAAWGLGQLFVPLAIIPLPLILFFGALALPLRKDQPMETFLAAMVSFYLKPHKRLWDPDGIESLIEITAPKRIEEVRTKNISEEEANRRLGYLAQIVDSRGWAVRGQSAVQAPNSMNTDTYFEAQQAQDILDADSAVARRLDYQLQQSDSRRHETMVNRIQQQAVAPTAIAPEPVPAVATEAPVPFNYFTVPDNPTESSPQLTYNPYPEMNQQVVAPISTEPAQPTVAPPTQTSTNTINPAIIELVNNAPDLSVETIAKQAARIEKQSSSGLDEETVVSLR